jgi:hemolysin activation/secretion protein
MIERRCMTFLKTEKQRVYVRIFILALLWAVPLTGYPQEHEEAAPFPIEAYEVEGNTIFPEEKLGETLAPFTGPDKTAQDVETAREALEKAYHLEGYISVLVNIPPQRVEEGTVRLEVIEGKIGKVRVTGNRYFTMEMIRRDLPALAPGAILYLPQVQEELNDLNRNQDLKVAPVLMPGRELGTVDVELKVTDKLPLHASVELNNRSIHDTTPLRLNAMVRYDNLWQREHSISFQYQTSPQDMDEVQLFAGSYVVPVPWNRKHALAVYGLVSDSDTAFGTGFEVVGKGMLIGARYVMSFGELNDSGLFGIWPIRFGKYSHGVALGVDYKDFDEIVGFEVESGEETSTPIQYLPFSVSYNGALPDQWGTTRFHASLNLALRYIVTDQAEFETKRYKAMGNYVYGTAGVDRLQRLPAGMSLFLKLDGQLASQPLVSNEQYIAGGMESVRGYMESEALGDNAVHGIVELHGPDLARLLSLEKHAGFDPYVFYDRAALWVKEALPDQPDSFALSGVGVGVRGWITRYLEYEVDWAVALSDTELTEEGSNRFYFRVKALF